MTATRRRWAVQAAATAWLWGAAPPTLAADVLFSEHFISYTNFGCRCVHAADLDGDDDLDFLSARANDNTVAWYENDGGAPPSFTEHIVATDRRRARTGSEGWIPPPAPIGSRTTLRATRPATSASSDSNYGGTS